MHACIMDCMACNPLFFSYRPYLAVSVDGNYQHFISLDIEAGVKGSSVEIAFTIF